MSKAARAIPGQRVMSRLYSRVATRPTFGPSPAFYARFGLDDPWATSGMGASDDPADPFVFLSAAHYYQRLRQMQIGRRRLMERFAAMQDGTSHPAIGERVSMHDISSRVSSFAT